MPFCGCSALHGANPYLKNALFSTFRPQKSSLADFSRKFVLLLLALSNTIPENSKVRCLEYLISILKTGS